VSPQFSYNAGNLLTTRGIASHWRRVVVTCDIKSVDCSECSLQQREYWPPTRLDN